LSVVTARYGKTLQFGDSSASADGVTSEKNTGPSPLHQPAGVTELNLNPTIIFRRENRGVWVL